MKKSKRYKLTRFTPDVIREAREVFRRTIRADKSRHATSLSAVVDDARWSYDSEDEFFADYRRTYGNADYEEFYYEGPIVFNLSASESATTVSIQAETRAEIEAVFDVFERHAAACLLPSPPEPVPSAPRVFIGHGHSHLWRDLKDHLHDKHGYAIEAYEIGARAGHSVRDILERLLEESSFAILVMTAEDATAEGGARARQNVVHETGLFQGKLGFHRAIVLVEEGTEIFSNLDGVDQIRFDRGRIKETFGEVLATLRREFPTNRS